jgi:AI-2 transport protein TqsA
LSANDDAAGIIYSEGLSMNQDGAEKVLLSLCAGILILGAAYFTSRIIALLVFALFIVAVVWPLQSTLQKKIPKLLALLITRC